MKTRKVATILRRMAHTGETLWPARCVWWAAQHLYRVDGDVDHCQVDLRATLLRRAGDLATLAAVRTDEGKLLLDLLESRASALKCVVEELASALTPAQLAFAIEEFARQEVEQPSRFRGCQGG